ncbi:MAG: Ni/Fe-hydrogenase cytochrome b subunit [Pseudomonadota bacterium]
MSGHAMPAPLQGRVRFWSPGALVMAALALVGLVFVAARYLGGLAAVTNLSQSNPWGLWIGVDVASGVALAAGGFTTAALAHVFGRHAYEPVVRPALLTALLGYVFVSLALVVDIGRSWAIWKPMIFWNPNSVLFEVAVCVMVYTTVLHIEFIPILAERLGHVIKPLAWLNQRLDKVMWFFIIAGVVLSCMHQSGLGSLMLIAPTKVHPLWYTPLLPLMFLASAMAVGYPMVVVENTIAGGSFSLADESGLLAKLTRITILLLGVYGALKIGDLTARDAWGYVGDGSVQSRAFIVEMLFGVIIPWLMLLSPAVRRRRAWLFTASFLVVAGVVINRINVFLVSFQPPYPVRPYFPSVGEIAITVGFIAALVLAYRFTAYFFPVLSPAHKEASA